jgi:hypothetical protein
VRRGGWPRIAGAQAAGDGPGHAGACPCLASTATVTAVAAVRRRTRRASRTTSTGSITLTGRRWARSRWATRCLRRRLRSTASSGSRRRPSACCWTTRRTWTARWSTRSRRAPALPRPCAGVRAQDAPALRHPALRHTARRPHGGPRRSRPTKGRAHVGARARAPPLQHRGGCSTGPGRARSAGRTRIGWGGRVLRVTGRANVCA